MKALVGDRGKKYEAWVSPDGLTVDFSTVEGNRYTVMTVSRQPLCEGNGDGKVGVTTWTAPLTYETDEATDPRDIMRILNILEPVFRNPGDGVEETECEPAPLHGRSKDHSDLLKKIHRLAAGVGEYKTTVFHDKGSVSFMRADTGGDRFHELTVRRVEDEKTGKVTAFLVFENYRDEHGEIRNAKTQINEPTKVMELLETLDPFFEGKNNPDNWQGTMFPLTEYIGIAHCRAWTISKIKRKRGGIGGEPNPAFLDHCLLDFDIPFSRFSEVFDDRPGVCEEERFKPLLAKVADMVGPDTPKPVVYEARLELFADKWLGQRTRRPTWDVEENFYDRTRGKAGR